MLNISEHQFVNAINKLGQLVQIPSISNHNVAGYDFQNLILAANWIEKELKELNFDVSLERIDDSAPFILAAKISDISKPTLLLYSHYDVQPVERDKWHGDPFKLIEKDGRLYGRGASDDKAGIIAILTALKAFKEANKELPVNIKILFEGEEEYGSNHMNPLLQKHAHKLNAEALIILDCGNLSVDTGTLTYATRGCVNLKLEVSTYEKPVHSGAACIGPDTAMILANLIVALADPSQIPGIKEGATALSDSERSLLQQSSQSEEDYLKLLKLNAKSTQNLLRGIANKTIFERIMEEPSITILNMQAGQPNGGNSIPSVASCEIGVRTLAGQNPDLIANKIKEYLLSKSSKNFKIEITQPEDGSSGWKGDLTKPFAQKYFAAMKQCFPEVGAKPTGGTLPLLDEFKKFLPNMEILCVGIEDPDTSAHSHNESQHIELFRRVINTLITFFEKAAEKKFKSKQISNV